MYQKEFRRDAVRGDIPPFLNPSQLDNVTNYSPNKNQSLTSIPIRSNYYRATYFSTAPRLHVQKKRQFSHNCTL